MMEKGLLLVGRIYYYQKRIPEKLANVLGVKMYKRSLETDSFNAAKKYVARLNEVFNGIFKEYKRMVNAYDDYSKEDMMKLLQVEFYKVVDSDNKRVVAVLEDKYLNKSKSGKKIKSLVRQYLDYLNDVKKLSNSTIRSIRSAIGVVSTLYGEKTVAELSTDDVKNVIDQYNKTSLSSSVKTYVTKLKSFLKWIQDSEDVIIPKAVFKFIADYRAGIKTEDVRDAFRVEQIKQIFSEGYIKEFRKPYYYFPLLLSFTCGLRMGEARAITIADVIKYKDRYLIRISEGKTENAKRYVVLPRILHDLGFNLYYDQVKNENPESSLWGKSVSITSIGKKFSKYLIKLGIKADMKDRRYTEHSLRHSFATKLIASGVDERYATKYFGHSGSSLMESRYLIQTPEIEDILTQVDAKLDFSNELAELPPLFTVTKEQLLAERKRFIRKFIKENYRDIEQHLGYNDNYQSVAMLYQQNLDEYNTKTIEEMLLDEDPEKMIHEPVEVSLAYLTRIKRLLKI